MYILKHMRLIWNDLMVCYIICKKPACLCNSKVISDAFVLLLKFENLFLAVQTLTSLLSTS